MVAYPQEMKVWATRAKCLCQSFDSGSKRMVEMVKDLFQFLNGDTKSDELIHYCKEDPDIPCCHSDTEALNRLAHFFVCQGIPRATSVSHEALLLCSCLCQTRVHDTPSFAKDPSGNEFHDVPRHTRISSF